MKKNDSRFQLIRASLILLACLSFLKAHSQSSDPTPFYCGTNADYFPSLAMDSTGELINPRIPITAVPLFSSAAIYHCGAIDVYYEDINSGVKRGFDDTTIVGGVQLGAIRRNTLCAVLNYVQSQLDFTTHVTSGAIRLYVELSLDPLVNPAVPGDLFLAHASPFYNGRAPGITAGYLNQYVTTGTDPAPASGYHAELLVNFDNTVTTGGIRNPIYWQNDYTSDTNCHIDLYSTILHEVTHALGWISFVKFAHATATSATCGCVYKYAQAIYNTPVSDTGIAAHLFTKLDTAINGAPVGASGPASLRPLIVYSGGVYSINPSAYNALNNYWLNGFPPPMNHAIFSGSSFNAYDSIAAPSFLSHMDDQRFAYSFRERVSPGDRQLYVMGPYGIIGAYRRTYTKGELQTLVRTLGYTYIGSSPAVVANHAPYSRKMGGYGITATTYADFTESVPADYTITNNIGTTLNINLSDTAFTASDIADLDGDTITIDTTTIANFRGCGSGGNNHSALSWTGAHPTTITYTPRPNFYGKAQIGFNLSDGHEKGSFRVVTIEVKRGTNVSPALSGGNMVCNPGFEEGSEVVTATDETRPNAYSYNNRLYEAKWQGINFSDSHPYCFHTQNIYTNPAFTNWYTVQFTGSVIYNANIACLGSVYTSPAEDGFLSAPNSSYTLYDNPLPQAATGGNRYQKFQLTGTQGESYYNLDTDITQCHHYILSFDIYKSNDYYNTTTCSGCSAALQVAFADTVNITAPVFNYTLPVYSFPMTLGVWQRDTLSFWYCGNPSHIMYFKNTNNADFSIDNLSLVPDPAPPPMAITLADTSIGSCQFRLYTSTFTNPGCTPTNYTWSGPSLSCTTCAAPVATPATITVYTLTVSDKCATRSATATVTVNPVVAPISGTPVVCVGTTATLGDATGGGTWSSAATSVATISSSGVLTGVAAGTAAISYSLPTGCYATVTATVVPHPSAITGSLTVCMGLTSALSDPVAGGTWSSSNASVATVGSASGIVSGVGLGTSVITYTAGGCSVTATVTVAPLPAAITGSLSACTGSTATVSDATGGGIWSSTNTSVATVGSATGIVSGVAAGTTTLSYTLATGCAATAVFTVNPLPVISGSGAVCAGATLPLSSTIAGAWTSSNPAIASVDATGTVTGVAAGMATITCTASGTGCTGIATVTVNPLPSGIMGSGSLCAGASATLTDASSGGTWSSDNLPVATVGSGSGIVTGISAGTAHITYTLPTGCYTAVTITVNPAPASIAGTTTVCVGLSVTLTDASAGGSWSSSNTAIATIGAGTGMVTGVAAGTATITYTLGTGCFSTTTVTVNTLPAITGSPSVCAGAGTLMSDAASGGTWSSSATGIATVGSASGLVTGIATGTAAITYTLGSGCYTSAIITVNALPAPITGTLSVCIGAATTLFDASGGGTWSSGATGIATILAPTGVASGVSSGTATITYALPTGCSVTAVLTVNPLPSAISGAGYICIGSPVTLADATGGGVWASGNTAVATIGSGSGTVTGITTGTAGITYTLPTGCYATATVTVIIVPASITGTLLVCPGATTALADATPGGSWSTASGAIALVGTSTGIVTGVATGTTTITYSLGGSCYQTAPVTVNTAPAPYAVIGGGAFCAGTTGVHVALPGSQTGVSYQLYRGGSPVGSPVAGTGFALDLGLYTTPGIYTATGTSSVTGCLTSMTGSATISINPAPAPISGPSVLCAGATITLSDTSGTWSSATPSVATVGSATGIVTGIAAGTDTIRFTVGSTGCMAIKVVTVYPTPATISGLSGVCRGATITLTDATTGGTWSSSGSAIAPVGTTTGIVTGAAIGTATITYTVGSCFVTKAVTVNPVPGPITGIINLCRAISDTLHDTTAGGVWSSRNTAVATIGSSSGIVTWTGAGIDTITYGFGSGCSVFTVIKAWDTTCVPCNVFGDTFTVIGSSGVISGNYGRGNYYIGNNVLVTGFDTFTNAIVLIAPGDTVYIDTNAFLSINNSHLFSQCNEWSGMMLKPGRTHSGRLYVTGQSLIENAKCAVYIPNAVTPASATDYVFKSDAATFNRNMCGVYITHYNPAIAQYPFSIKNTVFTGRDLQTTNPHFPYQWPPTAGVGGFKNYWNPSDTFLAPYNINSPAPGLGYSYRGAGTFSGLPISYGIRLDSVGNNNNPSTAATGLAIPGQYYEITVGDVTVTDNNGNQNLFDNMMYGIYSVNSNLTSVNNAFTNLFASNFRAVGYTGPMGGDGIYSVETDDFANQNRLRVYTPAGSHYNNRFYDFNYAVEASNMFQVIGQSCFMINKYFGTITSAPVGSGGFYIKTSKYDTLDISYDTITNVTNAIAVGMAYDPTVRYAYSGGGGFGYLVTIPSQYMGWCNLSSNVIQPHPIWGASLADQHVNVGISYQNTITLPAMSVATVANGLNIKSNIIHDAYNGIMVNGYNAPKPFLPTTAYNTVHLRRWSSQRMQYGVNSTNTLNGLVYYNYVSGPYAATSLNDSMKAYYSSYNTGMDIGCNYDSLVGRGFEFTLTNTGTNWHDNKMYGNLKGFVLNGGVIGPQVNRGTTSSSNSMNDEWQGTWGGATGDSQTYVISAASSSSPFYVQSSVSDMIPTVNGGRPHLLAYSMGSSILFATHVAGPCFPITSPPPTDTGNLNDLIAKQHVDFVYNVVPNNWMAQFALWKAALLDSTVIDSSAIVAQFVHMADSVSRFKYITSIEAALNIGDLATANYLLSLDMDSMANTARDSATQVTVADDVAADYIVSNYQQFYNIYIDYVTGAMTSHDSINILALAQLCPEQNGGVVFQARALYSNIFNDLSVFNDDSCIDVDTGYIAYRHSHNQQAGQDGMQQYRLFPNPNDGSFMLQQNLPDNNTAAVKIYDAVGRMVYTGSLQFTGGRASLNMGNYASGLYLLELKDDKNQIFRCKFVKQ